MVTSMILSTIIASTGICYLSGHCWVHSHRIQVKLLIALLLGLLHSTSATVEADPGKQIVLFLFVCLFFNTDSIKKYLNKENLFRVYLNSSTYACIKLYLYGMLIHYFSEKII